MFASYNGLPVHALAVHAAVVLIPLSALLGLLFAVPRLRAWSRWPLAIVSVVALAATYVSKESGGKLQSALHIDKNGGPVKDLIEKHSHLADQLFVIMIVYTVLAVVAAVLVRPRVRDGADRSSGSSAVAVALPALLVIAAIVVTVWTYRVGDAGAKAVWNPTGKVSYSVK